MQKAVRLMIKTWKNGALGGEVKKIIDYNFNVVSKYLSKNVRTLSTQERKLLSSDYLSEDLLVFDTDEKQWYKYSRDSWIKTSVENKMYTQGISTSDWVNGNITILFDQHSIENPVVQLFMKNNDSFIPVLGGVKIDDKHNITLSTDLPFDGKVVIK